MQLPDNLKGLHKSIIKIMLSNHKNNIQVLKKKKTNRNSAKPKKLEVHRQQTQPVQRLLPTEALQQPADLKHTPQQDKHTRNIASATFENGTRTHTC